MGLTSDVLIVGAGPVGLALALSLAERGLDVAIVEQQPEQALAEPADDGREIAMHRSSMRMLGAFGALRELTPEQIAPIAAARVHNGRSSRFLDFQPATERAAPIGHLIANHRIRRALYRQLAHHPNIRLYCEQKMRSVETDTHDARLTTDTDAWRAKLLVAADSRHSATRQALGIAAHLHDFGKTMLVCRVEAEHDHGAVACEWFDLGRTIATLPLHGRQVSVAITVTHRQAEQLAQLPEAAFNETLGNWLRQCLGDVRLISPRWRYPLIATYAQAFHAPRTALIGDAAVGMHPVTAHGFNFGLRSQQTLSTLIGSAQQRRQDIANPRLLKTYERRHRAHTLPLFLATNGIVDLYTRHDPVARIARQAGIALSSKLPPFRRAVLRQLMREA
ncbi:5-demethoxyubiquinol-8 5-hydroxylase UbiM [Solimonas marina]|uniref:5-demethoxyubiquinol-8 5-hydroxylase UbiM n=1 Tax=Solimonas marina TaxID=2714601 RepID=A0A969WC63_9GAMM|nr:5-demethoxyubiquinol-8 5-hydroxylase UbiM [Solimonas marina]NKF24497.1 5-demethoxyubiquinol-8 5-hydroxylase UbiM [Solimonas marina]